LCVPRHHRFLRGCSLLRQQALLNVHAAFAFQQVDDLQVPTERCGRVFARRILTLGDTAARVVEVRIVLQVVELQASVERHGHWYRYAYIWCHLITWTLTLHAMVAVGTDRYIRRRHAACGEQVTLFVVQVFQNRLLLNQRLFNVVVVGVAGTFLRFGFFLRVVGTSLVAGNTRNDGFVDVTIVGNDVRVTQ
jgi:hypothetical protein